MIFIGVYKLNGFIAVNNIKAENPKEIILFTQQHGNHTYWYAAALECRGSPDANLLVIYHYDVSNQ